MGHATLVHGRGTINTVPVMLLLVECLAVVLVMAVGVTVVFIIIKPGRSLLAIPHATIFPIPRNSRQDPSTYPSHELRRIPVGLLLQGLSLTEWRWC